MYDYFSFLLCIQYYSRDSYVSWCIFWCLSIYIYIYINMRCTSHIVHTLYHHDQKMFVLAFDAIMFLLLLHVKFNMLNMQGARHHKTVNGSPQLLFFGSDLMISDLLRAPCRGVASPSPCASPETRLLPSESQRHSAGEEGTWRNIKSQFSWWRWCFLHTWWHTVFLITFGCMFLKSRLKIFLRLMNGSMIEAYWHVLSYVPIREPFVFLFPRDSMT